MVRRMMVALVACGLITAAVPAASAQTVEEIVAKNYASKGGLEKWKSITTQRMEGIASTQGFELGMVVYGKRPNLGRQDLTIDIGQGPMTMVQLFDGQRSWMVNPMMGSTDPIELSGPDAETIREQSDFDGALVDYAAKGYVVELVGPATVGGKAAHHLKVTRKDLSTQHYYLDVETGVELRITTEVSGGPAIDTEMSDYRSINGILVPHMIRVQQAGQTQAELRITKVEFNVPLDDALFKVR